MGIYIKNKNKGFTLIELLAVIVILALIALVTIPMINNVIEKAEKGALEDSAYGLIKAADFYYASNMLDGTQEKIEFTFLDGKQTSEDKLSIKGKVEKGNVRLYSDGKVALCITEGDYAAVKNVSDSKVSIIKGRCNYNSETEEYETVGLCQDLQDEITKLKQEHEEEIATITKNYEEQANQLEEDYEAQKATIEETYKDQIEALNQKIAELEETHNADLEQLKSDYEGQLKTQQETYEAQIEILNQQLTKTEEDYSKIKNALYNKTIISSINNNADIIVGEINSLDLNQGEAANKKSIVDSLKYSGLGITEDMSWDEIATILSDTYPEVAIGTEYYFNYTGDIQTFEVKANGLYKLEVYGAKGSNSGGSYNLSGGWGGYSSGYVELKVGDVLYVVVGGLGTTATSYKPPDEYSQGNITSKGGYNGGGTGTALGTQDHVTAGAGGGGGATHIATRSGTLASLGNTNGLLIVAGGGGGAYGDWNYGTANGGTGGGTTGGSTTGGNHSTPSAGGTQTSGYSFGQGGNGSSNRGGGGGGLYGGAAGGGGGSGYIGGVPKIEYKGTTYSPSTSNGANSGEGKATITYIAR